MDQYIAVRYENSALCGKAVSYLRVMENADFATGVNYICVNQQQLEALVELGLIPDHELKRLREANVLPPPADSNP